MIVSSFLCLGLINTDIHKYYLLCVYLSLYRLFPLQSLFKGHSTNVDTFIWEKQINNMTTEMETITRKIMACFSQLKLSLKDDRIV